jgi:hypothetical protein
MFQNRSFAHHDKMADFVSDGGSLAMPRAPDILSGRGSGNDLRKELFGRFSRAHCSV